MDQAALQTALASVMPSELAKDLVDSYVELRQDVGTKTLGRSSPGKFVETLAQVLQYMESGQYDVHPVVDTYLKGVESRPGLDDDLRLGAARIARSMYTLRNKRNIAHKASIDPNLADLRYLLAAAQWVMAELLRRAANVSMKEADGLVSMVQSPVGEVIEDFGSHRVVLAELTIRDELLVLLHAAYPNRVMTKDLLASTGRRVASSVARVLRQMWTAKLIEGDNTNGYRLTRLGFDSAAAIIQSASS
jgi:hypothetical protein